MKPIIPRFSIDQWVLTACSLFSLAVGSWAVWGETAIATLRVPLPALAGTELEFEPVDIETSRQATVSWPEPAGDRVGDDWAFDVFTPPVIFYNRQTGKFSISRPQEAPSESRADEIPFGLIVLVIEPELYRLQLVGYAGGGDEPWGIFQNEITGEGVVARAGDRFEDLGLVVRSLDVRREDTIVPESMPLREIVAVAGVWDERAETSVRLSSAGRRWTDTPTVTLRAMKTGEERTLKAGESWQIGEDRYEVLAVSVEVDRVEIRKILPDGTDEIRTLGPKTAEPSHFDADTTFGTP